MTDSLEEIVAEIAALMARAIREDRRRDEAQNARIAALEEQVAALTRRLASHNDLGLLTFGSEG